MGWLPQRPGRRGRPQFAREHYGLDEACTAILGTIMDPSPMTARVNRAPSAGDAVGDDGPDRI